MFDNKYPLLQTLFPENPHSSILHTLAQGILDSCLSFRTMHDKPKLPIALQVNKSVYVMNRVLTKVANRCDCHFVHGHSL